MMRRDDSFDEGLIQLVDYDALSLIYLFEELTRAGYRVNTSSASRKALDSIRATKPEIVFCNLHMPEIDGLKLLAEVRRTSPSTRVILMSSCGDWAVYEEALRAGAFDLVPKPVAARVLRKILNRVGLCRKSAAGHPGPFN
ncbi:MAG TPA: response regulator [Planctomycetota bacterium]|nr:response regulator [Planctomycetota bacterium]